MVLDKIAILVGKNIASQRKRLGMTQKELSEKLEITENSVTRMEKGIIAPKLARLEDLATHLECSIAYLFDDPAKESKVRTKLLQEYIEKASPQFQEDLLTLILTMQKMHTNQNVHSDEHISQLIMAVLKIVNAKQKKE